MVNTEEFDFGGPRSFFGRAEHIFVFNSNIDNFLLKTNEGKTEELIVLFL